MSPQEKAKELVEKFTYSRSDDHEKYVAKQCALIAVEELIEYSKEFDSIRDINGDPYWQEKKQEIEKL